MRTHYLTSFLACGDPRAKQRTVVLNDVTCDNCFTRIVTLLDDPLNPMITKYRYRTRHATKPQNETHARPPVPPIPTSPPNPDL